MSIQITTTELPTGYVGEEYHFTLAAVTHPMDAPLSWSIKNTLPLGLTINAITGTISGLCQRDYWSSMTIWVQNTTTGETTQKVLTLFIANNDSLEIVTETLEAATVGQAYLATLLINGGKAPYHWNIINLPPGLSAVQGKISGTPVQEGDACVSVTVTDSSSPPQTVQRSISLQVNPQLQPLAIVTDSLQPGVVGQTYQKELIASGGLAPYLWSATGLPAGLQLESSIISGKPTGAGTFTIILKVNDSATPVNSKQQQLTLKVSVQPQILTISTPALAAATLSVPYSQQLTATGGVEPYQWSSDGLPIGLSISGNSISGQVSVSGGSVPLTLRVTDGKQATASQFYLLDINP